MEMILLKGLCLKYSFFWYANRREFGVVGIKRTILIQFLSCLMKMLTAKIEYEQAGTELFIKFTPYYHVGQAIPINGFR